MDPGRRVLNLRFRGGLVCQPPSGNGAWRFKRPTGKAPQLLAWVAANILRDWQQSLDDLGLFLVTRQAVCFHNLFNEAEFQMARTQIL